MTQPGCTKMAITQLLLGAASSNLVRRKSKCYFIIKFSSLLFIRLCWREIRPDTGKTTEKCACYKFSLKMTTQRRGFGQNSCAVDEQARVSGSCEFNERSVLRFS